VGENRIGMVMTNVERSDFKRKEPMRGFFNRSDAGQCVLPVR
jgi:hypothetical protein